MGPPVRWKHSQPPEPRKMKWTVCVLFDPQCSMLDFRTKWKVKMHRQPCLLLLNRTLHCTKWDCGTAIRRRTQYGLSSRVGPKHTELALLRRLTLFRGFAFVHCGTYCSPLEWNGDDDDGLDWSRFRNTKPLDIFTSFSVSFLLDFYVESNATLIFWFCFQ